jgi:hypothetical protein
LVQARIDHADAGCTDADTGCHPDTGSARAHIAGTAGLIEARVTHTDARRTDSGGDAGARCADAKAGVTRCSRAKGAEDEHADGERGFPMQHFRLLRAAMVRPVHSLGHGCTTM